MPRRWWLVLIIASLFILFPKICFANSAVILYKFSANNGTDWVEIFNNGSEDINLYGYYIEDGTSKVEDLSCILKAEGHYFINCGVRLNMNSDVILLKDSSGELVDCVAYGDEKCSGRESFDLEAPGESKYGLWNGSTWEITSDSSKADNSDCQIPTNIPTPTPTPTSTLTPTPTGAQPTDPQPTDSQPTDTPTPTEVPDDSFSIKGIFSSPVKIEAAFNVVVEVKNGGGNQEYYLKIRLGQNSSLLNQGQTLVNVSKWLSDTAAWTEFPVIKTDYNGEYAGTVKAKVKLGSPLGDYYLKVRLCELEPNGDCGAKIDSLEYYLVVNEADPFASTPTPTRKLTTTPTPKLSPTTTPTPKEMPSEKEESTPTPEGEVLGKEVEESGGGKKKILAGGLISLGGGLVVFASFFGKKGEQNQNAFDTIEEDEQEA